MRPKQWTKNLVVFAAFVFALGDVNQQVAVSSIGIVMLAALSFCLASSGVYLINDVRDVAADRAHPHKRHRPIAAGRVSPPQAVATAIQLVAVALILGYLLRPMFAAVIAAYVVLQLLYTFWLKRVAMIDIFMIAIGFVLRADGGALVIGVNVSHWLLVCTFLLAMFLGLCKRRQEYVSMESDGHRRTRVSLRHYDEKLLDQLIGVVASATLVSYAIYTLAPDTVQKFGHSRLSYTLIFVMYGLFRYLHLVYHRDLGERPEQILLTDLPLLTCVGLYAAAVMLLLYS